MASINVNLIPTFLVLRFLSVREAEALACVCSSFRRAIASISRRKVHLRAVGAAPDRLAVWTKLLCVGDLDLVKGTGGSVSKAYAAVLGGQARRLSQFSIDGVEGEIQRDVTRTFPNHPSFANGALADKLANVLLALSKAAPQVGYCQGMNFVVGALLTLADAPRVFGIALALVRHLELEQLWQPGVPKLKYRIFQFDRLLASQDPELHAHFASIGLAPDFFCISVVPHPFFIQCRSLRVPLESVGCLLF